MSTTEPLHLATWYTGPDGTRRLKSLCGALATCRKGGPWTRNSVAVTCDRCKTVATTNARTVGLFDAMAGKRRIGFRKTR